MHRFLGRKRSDGFTLIELLVVVAIIAILAFVVITNLNSARSKARDSKIQSDLSGISTAIQLNISNGGDVTQLPVGDRVRLLRLPTSTHWLVSVVKPALALPVTRAR